MQLTSCYGTEAATQQHHCSDEAFAMRWRGDDERDVAW